MCLGRLACFGGIYVSEFYILRLASQSWGPDDGEFQANHKTKRSACMRIHTKQLNIYIYTYVMLFICLLTGLLYMMGDSATPHIYIYSVYIRPQAHQLHEERAHGLKAPATVPRRLCRGGWHVHLVEGHSLCNTLVQCRRCETMWSGVQQRNPASNLKLSLPQKNPKTYS